MEEITVEAWSGSKAEDEADPLAGRDSDTKVSATEEDELPEHYFEEIISEDLCDIPKKARPSGALYGSVAIVRDEEGKVISSTTAAQLPRNYGSNMGSVAIMRDEEGKIIRTGTASTLGRVDSSITRGSSRTRGRSRSLEDATIPAVSPTIALLNTYANYIKDSSGKQSSSLVSVPEDELVARKTSNRSRDSKPGLNNEKDRASLNSLRVPSKQ